MLIRCQVTALLLCTVVLESSMAADSSIHQSAKKVTIYRDSFGVPHIDAEDQSASAFGMADGRQKITSGKSRIPWHGERAICRTLRQR